MQVEYEVKPSPIAGVGLFLTKPVARGSLLWRYKPGESVREHDEASLRARIKELGPDAVQDLLINPYHTSAGCAFKKALTGDKLLVPFESDALYSTSHYEGSTEGGRVAFKKFKLNAGTSSSKLVERYRNRKYQFVARVTNPFFVGIIEPVRSVPFRVKSVFYNDLAKDDRFVRTSTGDVVHSPLEDVP